MASAIQASQAGETGGVSISTFGDRVRERRLARGLSQEQLGGNKYSASYISHLESGRRRPTPDVLDHLAEKLELDAEELLALGWVQTPVDNDAVMRLAEAQAGARHAWESHDYDGTRAESRAAATLAAELNRPDAWWEMSLLTARALLALERYEECWTLARVLSEHPWVRGSPRLACEALVLAAKSLRASGSGEEALAAAECAELGSRGLPANLTRVQALVSVISAQGEFGELACAESQISALTGLVDRLKSRRAVGEATWALGNVAFLQGRIDTGVAYHDRAARNLSPAADLRGWGRFQKATAQVRLAAGITDQVEGHLDDAVAALRLVGNHSDLQELDMTRAELLLVTRRYDEALDVLDTMDLRATPGGDPTGADDDQPPGHLLATREQLRKRAFLAKGDLGAAMTCSAAAARHLDRAGAYRRALDEWESYSQLHAQATGQPGANDQPGASV